MRRSIVSLFAIVASTAPAWGTSSVGDARFATGATACRQVSTGGTPNYTSAGTLRNDSTTANMLVICPLGYLTSGASPGSPVYIEGYVHSNGTAIPCTFIVENLETGATFSVAMASSAAAGRQFVGASVTTFSGTTNAYLRAYCSIPKKNASLAPAWIYGFEVDGQ